MYLLLFLRAVDTNLGRVDLSSFSDQILMEMLLGCLDDETKQRYQDNQGVYLDVCKWGCVRCDEENRVVDLHYANDVSGSLHL